MSLVRHSDCRACDLWEGCQSVGLPTLHYQGNFLLSRNDRALLCIGEAPGREEDQQAEVWVGQSGQILRKFIDTMGFADLAEVFLGNACRCRPIKNTTPTHGRINACRPWLTEDLAWLKANYKEVIVFCLGASAAFSVAGTSLGTGFKRQGQLVDGLRVFYANHPAILLAGREPALIRSVTDHFNLVRDYLLGRFNPAKQIAAPAACQLPPDRGFPALLTLDIETYGILRGQDQTVFHPAKSVQLDGVPRHRLIVSAALAWSDGQGVPVSMFFRWPEHKDVLHAWLQRAKERGSVVVGKNLPFDVSYLRYADTAMRGVLSPPLRLDDVSILNFLDFELRPEKGLKSLSELLGVADYQSLEVNASEDKKARSGDDPALALYNCTDAVATLKLHPLLLKSMESIYGPGSPKLSPLCSEHRNQLLWLTVWMAEAGVPADRRYLTDLDKKLARQMAQVEAFALTKHGITLSGKGSKGSILEAVTKSIVGVGLQNDRRIKLTKVERDYSIGKSNLNLLLSVIPLRDPRRLVPAILRAYSRVSKLRSSYTKPLLTKPRRGILPDGRMYPSWFATPDFAGKNEDDGEKGGQIQGRMSAQKPGMLTLPAVIKKGIRSHWLILKADMSQLELRIAALCSGEPTLLDVYRAGGDVHLEAMKLLWPTRDWAKIKVAQPDFYKLYRTAAKSGNFLILYRGGPETYQQTLREDVGLELTLPFCREVVDGVKKLRPVLWAWQDSLIAQATRQHFLEVPTGWSRSYYGDTQTVLDTYINEICNQPVQTLAAQLVQSAQFACEMEFRRLGLRARTIINEYDSLWVECPRSDRHLVLPILDRYLTHPPLLPILEKEYGRSVPLTYELEVIQPLAQAPAVKAYCAGGQPGADAAPLPGHPVPLASVVPQD